MESSPFLHPGFIVPAVAGLIGFISWLIRLEAKSTANAVANAKLEAENSQIWGELERHKENQDIHFNQKVSAEVEKANARRFETIESELKDIKGMLKERLR